MDWQAALDIAVAEISALKGHTADILEVRRPRDIESAVAISKVVSKLSPFVGNVIEQAVVDFLNSHRKWPKEVRWVRQDPDFPDVVLSGMQEPRPGIEIKAWMPFATEITARFKDSQSLLMDLNTKVAVICWLPEYVIAGRPPILDVWIGQAIDFAIARDNHYHNPPDYIVTEPEDTAQRTRNLRQKNCTGSKFQGSTLQLEEARKVVMLWGHDGKRYRPDREYQRLLRDLMNKYPYRLDTNFAKSDRIVLGDLDAFKSRASQIEIMGRSIQQWKSAIRSQNRRALEPLVDSTSDPPMQ